MAYGRRSGDPAQTLFGALQGEGREEEALAVLEKAMALRPSDHGLKLFGAHAHAARGDLERADLLLSAARWGTHRASWLRTAATVAARRGDRATALQMWREVLVVEPAARDGQEAVEMLQHPLHRLLASLLPRGPGVGARASDRPGLRP